LTSLEPDASVTMKIISRDAHMDHCTYHRAEFSCESVPLEIVTPSCAAGRPVRAPVTWEETA
jgi:hypothetical protein